MDKKLLKLKGAFFLVVGLASVATQAQTQTTRSNWQNGNGVVEFPPLSDSYFSEVSMIDVQQLNLLDTMDKGLNKEQVVRLIGRPHFKEGTFGVRVWDYAFRFRQADNTYKVCQYQIHFSKKPNLVEKLYTNCFASAPPVVKKAPKMITLSADALFAFGRSGVNDVSTKGLMEIRQLGQQLNQAYSRVDALKITGHTDYVGSDASNLMLSQARANTVRQMLANLGVPMAVMSTEGRGEAEPVTSCAGNLPKQQLVDCLVPNRRVTIQVTGQERIE